jgi:hypothetical protein
VAQELNVKPEEVVEMETRLAGADVALEPQEGDGETGPVRHRSPTWPTMGHEPTQVLESRRPRLCWPTTACAARSTCWTRAAAASSRALAEGQRRRQRRHDAA